MTKQDILNMTDLRQINKAIADHRYLWDAEVNEHMKAIAKKENVEKFGDENALYTPPKRQNHNN